MQAVILAGGLGTRLSEETDLKPKPMVEIGGKPILWHIMKIYSSFGVNEFIICCGYKGYIIKEYFANYLLHKCDIEVNLGLREVNYIHDTSEPWKIKLIDTGEQTMTGGRLKRIERYVDDTFLFTYGDGVSNVNIKALIECHRNSGKLATLTAVNPPGRYGVLELNDRNEVVMVQEKPSGDGSWINGGFFVLEPGIFKYITNDSDSWENAPMNSLAANNQISAYKHYGFWQPMDTLRDKRYLESLWTSEQAPWKLWS